MRLGKKSFAVGLTMVALLTMVLSACSTTGGGNSTLPDNKQIMRFIQVPNETDVATLDPALTPDVYSYQMEQLIFPQLYTWDTNLNTIPWAADGMPTVSNGGATYTIKIKPNLSWSDGTPIDATTFAYSLNRVLDPCVKGGAPGSAAYFITAIKGAAAFNGEKCNAPANALDPTSTDTLVGKSIVVQDPHTLVITLEQPAAYFLKALTTSASMAVPQQLIQKYGWKNWTDHLADNQLSGNLFGVKLWDHKGHLDFVRNDGFKNFGLGANPILKEVDTTIYQSGDASYADYNNGREDIGAVPTSDYSTAKTRSDFHQGPTLTMGYIAPNWNIAPFNNVDARRAFALAVNKQLIADSVLKGTVIASNHFIPAGNPGYNPNLQGVEGAPLTGDQTKAKADMAKYVAEACNNDITKCPKVNFYDNNDPSELPVTSALMAQWNTVFPGYPITAHNVSFGDLINLAYGPASAQPQLLAIGYAVDFPDPWDWTSLQAEPTSSTNFFHINDPAATALMTAADVNQDQTTRFQQYQQAEQILVNDVGWITLDQSKQFWLQNPKLHNFGFDSNLFPAMSQWQSAYLTA